MTKNNYKSVSKQLISCLALSSLLLIGSLNTHAETIESSTTQSTEEVILKQDTKVASEAIFSLNDKGHKVSDKLFMLVTENEDKELHPLLVKEDDDKEQVVAFKATKKEEIVVPDSLLKDEVINQLEMDFKLIELSAPEEKLDEMKEDNVYLLSQAETKQIQKQFSGSAKTLEKNLEKNYDAIAMTVAYDDQTDFEGVAYAMKSMPDVVPQEASTTTSKKDTQGLFSKKEYAEGKVKKADHEPNKSEYTLKLTSKEVTLEKGAEQPTSQELKEWFTAVDVLEGDTTVKDNLEDYTVTLINPTTVDTQTVGIAIYDVKVEGNYEGSMISSETRVKVEIEDGKGKGEGETPPPNKEKPKDPVNNSGNNTSDNKSSSKNPETLPQTGENFTSLLLPLGMVMVSLPVIFVYLRK
ncbi:LPXTG cell wall anchor domain-containing protein [Vagococcus jeotgali]|uniref:LPXTG cell wall anchor domain-containing protein n=1 Tax=Vagococcus jeotgali TaxID=3109030 RepID=UPI002DDA0AA0|nr:LPXTG cell wall anchor domain-containing protein [Vagococcus sp. B2T-5]